MVKLIGPKKIRTAVFISGTGSNLKNLIKFSLKKKNRKLKRKKIPLKKGNNFRLKGKKNTYRFN